MSRSGSRSFADSPVGCLWIIAAIFLIPIIHYLFAGAVLFLALASVPFGLRLVRAIELRNALRSKLVGAFFTSSKSCGKIESVEVDYLRPWPRLSVEVFLYMLSDSLLSGLRRSVSLEDLSVFAARDESRWPALAAKSMGLTLQTDISPEAKAIELLVRSLDALNGGNLKLNSLDKKISELSASARLCLGNPLLEPSLDNIEKMLDEATRIRAGTRAEIEAIEGKALALSEFLSLPESVRTSLADGVSFEEGISGESLDQDFYELAELVRTLDDLIDGRG